MGEFNGVQLESREVGDGRTILGTSAIAQREVLDATQKAGALALAGAGAALKAIDTGRSQVTAATEVLKGVDEQFGKARRTTAALLGVQAATARIDERVAQLIRDPDIDPLTLADTVDREVLQIRNEAVAASGQVGPQAQQYTIAKLGDARRSAVGKARTAGYKREADEQNGRYLDARHQIFKQINDPATSLQRRVELFEDLNVLTESFSFYLGDETVARLKDSDLFAFRKNQFIENYLIDPQTATKSIDSYGFTAEQRVTVLRSAQSALTAGHFLEREERQEDAARRALLNEERFNEAVQGELADGGRSSAQLARLQAAAIQNEDLVPALLQYERRVNTQRQIAKQLGQEAPSDPATRQRFLSRANSGDFDDINDVTATGVQLARDGVLAYSDINAGERAFLQRDASALRGREQEINRGVSLFTRRASSLFAREVVGPDGIRKIPSPADKLSVLGLANDLKTELDRASEAGTLGDVNAFIDDFLETHAGEFGAGLLQKEFSTVFPYPDLETLLDDDAVSQATRDDALLFDRLKSVAQRKQTERQRQQIEAEAAKRELEVQKAQAKVIEVVGAETFAKRKKREEARAQATLRRKSVDERILEFTQGERTPEADVPRGKLFRFKDGVAVDVSTAPTEADRLEKTVDDVYNLSTTAEQRLDLTAAGVEARKSAIRSQILVRQTQSVLDAPRRAIQKQAQAKRDAREADIKKRADTAAANAKLKQAQEALKLLNDQRKQLLEDAK